MKKFYERYAGHDAKVLRSVALLPWSHNLLLLNKGFNDEAAIGNSALFPVAISCFCLLYTSPSPRDDQPSRMPSSRCSWQEDGGC